MTMAWVPLNVLTPMLQVFDDAWHILWGFQDLLQKLASLHHEPITPEQFAKILTELGFKDLTKRTDPENLTGSLAEQIIQAENQVRCLKAQL